MADAPFAALLASRHPSVSSVAKFFAAGHLGDTPHGAVSRRFQIFAAELLVAVPADTPELTVALRKLLEAKDAAVRAALEAAPSRQ